MSKPAADAGSGPLRKFNPGLLQSDGELVEQFVVRERELRLVGDVLRSNVDAPSCQHVLVVAPRGRGKTMLLARVAAEIRADAALAADLVPVRFMEESAEVFSLADFWMETLFHLAREIAGQEPGPAKELSDTHAALSLQWRDESLEGSAQAAVLDAADRLDRRLVLMVENVQSLVAAVDEGFGWGLRAVLQSVPQVILVASATSRFEGLDDPGAPFFELFRVVHLEPLDTEECRRLWTAVSGQAAHRHEIRPLEILTGGSPRLIVVVAAFARHRSLRELMEELVGLVDEHTEYFRGHLEALPRNERRVFVSLIDLWQASSTGEIAARARLDVRVVSTMLGRLVARGAVTAMPAGTGGKRLYAPAERLYSIYYKLRRERDEAAVVEALIHFMVAFYDVAELYQASAQLLQDAIGSTAIQVGIDRALAKRIVPVDDLRSWMKWKEVERTSDEVRSQRRWDALVRLQEEVRAAYANEDWQRVLDVAARNISDGWVDAESGWGRYQDLAYLWLLSCEAHYCLEQFREVIAIGNEAAERLASVNEATVVYRSASIAVVKAAAHLELGDFEVAGSECRDVIGRFGPDESPWYDVQVAAALLVQAKAARGLGEAERAADLLDEVVARFWESEKADVQRSVVGSLLVKAEMAREADDWKAVARTYGEAIERFRGSGDAVIRDRVSSAWLNRGFACGGLGDFVDELSCYDGLVEWLGEHDAAEEKWDALIALMHKSRRLAELGRGEEALGTVAEAARWFERKAEECLPETRMWIGWHLGGSRALALMSAGGSAQAMDAFREAYGLFLPQHALAMAEMLRLVPELVAAGASEEDLIGVLLGDGRKAQALQPLVVALRTRTGESVRGPAEMLEVAADLVARIEKRLANGVAPGFMFRKGGV